MKVSFLSDKLQEKITYLNHAVSSRTQLPILSCFLIEAKKGKLTVSSTDLEIGLTTSISANVEEEGSVAIPAKNFVDLLSNIGSQKITLTQEGEALELKGDRVKATFQTMSPDDFPKLYEEEGEEYARLRKEEMEKYFQSVVFAAAVDSSRPALSGVLIDVEEKGTLLVATDSYRLSLQKNVFKQAHKLKRPLVVPSRVIKEALLIKEGGEVVIKVSEKNNQVLFVSGDVVLVGRLIEAEYPEYQKIIPTEFVTKTTTGREDLLKAIKIASVFAKETANIVRLSIEKNKITVSSNSPSVGQDSADIDAVTVGEVNEIAFNAKYLLDILSALPDENIIFEMNNPLSPGVFRIKDDSSFLHLIMPIRVQG